MAQLSIRLDDTLKERIDKQAEAVGMSTTDYVVELLEVTPDQLRKIRTTVMTMDSPTYFLRHETDPRKLPAKAEVYILVEANLAAQVVFDLDRNEFPMNLTEFLKQTWEKDSAINNGYFVNMPELMNNYNRLFKDRPIDEAPATYWERAVFMHPTFGEFDMSKVAIRLNHRATPGWIVTYNIKSVGDRAGFDRLMRRMITAYMAGNSAS